MLHAPVAQLVERSPRLQSVVGSNAALLLLFENKELSWVYVADLFALPCLSTSLPSF